MSTLEDPKRERFCLEYVVDLNQSAAYVRAGYAKKGAAQNASRLMTNDKVRARIRELIQQQLDAAETTAEEIAREYRKVAFASMRRFISVDENGQPQINLTDTPDDSLDALVEVQTETVLEGKGEGKQRIRKSKIKLHGKLEALEALAKRVNFFEKDNTSKGGAIGDAIAEIMARGGSRAPIATKGER